MPEQIPPAARDESFAGVSYHVRGELVPQLQIEIGERQVMFEHHVLLWKTAPRDRAAQAPGRHQAQDRRPRLLHHEDEGPGHDRVLARLSGHTAPLHLSQGQELHVREHQFLAATANLDYTFERVKGVRNMLFGGTGFFIDKFSANHGDGIVWLHGYGNVFLAELGPGEQLDVEAGAWLYKDPTVKLEAITLGLKMGMFGGGGNSPGTASRARAASPSTLSLNARRRPARALSADTPSCAGPRARGRGARAGARARVDRLDVVLVVGRCVPFAARVARRAGARSPRSSGSSGSSCRSAWRGRRCAGRGESASRSRCVLDRHVPRVASARRRSRPSTPRRAPTAPCACCR